MEVYVCNRCKRDKNEPKRFSADNDMNPGKVPSCLRGLSQVEEMLIARACPIMAIYRNIQGFLDSLPRNVCELPVLLVRRSGQENTHTDLRVRREQVLAALEWLKANNPFYADITIDIAALSQLPEDGIPSTLLTVDDTTKPGTNEPVNKNETPVTVSSHSFLPLPQHTSTEEEGIRAILNGNTIQDWPTLGNQPINEFKTSGLATMAFPSLFPFGTGDPTCPGHCRKVSLIDAFKHLVKYAEEVDTSITGVLRVIHVFHIGHSI